MSRQKKNMTIWTWIKQDGIETQGWHENLGNVSTTKIFNYHRKGKILDTNRKGSSMLWSEFEWPTKQPTEQNTLLAIKK